MRSGAISNRKSGAFALQRFSCAAPAGRTLELSPSDAAATLFQRDFGTRRVMLRPGSSIPARLRATAGIPGTPQHPASGPALFPCCRVRALGGVQAGPPDKGRIISGRPARRTWPSAVVIMTATTRPQGSAIFAPAADEVGLHAVHTVDAGIEGIQRNPAVVAALPGRALQASACKSGRPPPPGLPVRTWKAWPDECPRQTPAAAKAPGRTPTGPRCRPGRRRFFACGHLRRPSRRD